MIRNVYMLLLFLSSCLLFVFAFNLEISIPITLKHKIKFIRIEVMYKYGIL